MRSQNHQATNNARSFTALSPATVVLWTVVGAEVKSDIVLDVIDALTVAWTPNNNISTRTCNLITASLTVEGDLSHMHVTTKMLSALNLIQVSLSSHTRT